MNEFLTSEEIKQAFELFYKENPIFGSEEKTKTAMYTSFIEGVIQERNRTAKILEDIANSFKLPQ